jgi:hypothetical protein
MVGIFPLRKPISEKICQEIPNGKEGPNYTRLLRQYMLFSFGVAVGDDAKSFDTVLIG